MNAFIKISALAVTAALVGVSAQAQGLDNASLEVYGPTAPVAIVKAPVIGGVTRAEVRAEQARALAAGELDFAVAEINGVQPQGGSVSASQLRLASRTAK